MGEVPLYASYPQEEQLYRNVQRFPGGLVFKVHRRVYHSTPGLRVTKKKEEERSQHVGIWAP